MTENNEKKAWWILFSLFSRSTDFNPAASHKGTTQRWLKPQVCQGRETLKTLTLAWWAG